tara:strand:- start:697 stop:996 length:300 start_codon:yes stop_codon:yes gene_type:complete
MGPIEIKQNIYEVMTNSRELTNYCQESAGLERSKKISDSLDNVHFDSAIDFITGCLKDQNQLFYQSNDVNFETPLESGEKLIYMKVIDYIKSNLSKINR